MSQIVRKLFKLYYTLTFIGTVFHELAHKKFAEGRGLEIIDVSYFSLSGEELGYVKHSPPKTYLDVFAVNVAPFIFNTGIAVVGLVATLIYQQTAPSLSVKTIAILLIGYWFSLSLLLHSFPSHVDMTNITKTIKLLWERTLPNVLKSIQSKIRSLHIIIRIILLPITLLISITHILIFMLKHMIIALTLPAIVIMKILTKTRKHGSAIYYTITITAFTHQIILPEVMAIPQEIIFI